MSSDRSVSSRTWSTIAGAVAMVSMILALAAPVAVAAPPPATPEPIASCFWIGPSSTEVLATNGFNGEFNNFPEEATTYWLARFRVPEGARLELEAQFAHARYTSLNAYNAQGQPIDALADYQTAPEPGSQNPFLPGAKRNTPDRKRAYRVRLSAEAPPTGTRAPNTLYTGTAGGESQVYYRVYVRDEGTDLTGDAGLPVPVLTLADGTVLRGDAACAAINTPDRTIPVLSIPAATWQAFRNNTPGCDPQTFPAFNPFHWERFFNITAATQGLALECQPGGHEQRTQMDIPDVGGAYSNRDINYILGFMSTHFGRVLVLRGKAPTFPDTFSRRGPKRMGSGQVRYWSVCTYESRVTTRVGDCVADYQVPLDRNGNYTIVVSRPEDRPADATERCGVAWVSLSPGGDGAGDPTLGQVIMRQLLPDPNYQEAIRRITRHGQEQAVMGPYYPQPTYLPTPEAFSVPGCDERPGHGRPPDKGGHGGSARV